MDDFEIAILEAAQRMDIFGDANSAAFPSTSKGGQYFAQLKTLLAQLPEPSITKESTGSAKKSNTRRKAVLSREIIAKLRLVANTADLIEEEEEDFENTFDLPRGRMSYQQQLGKAETFLQNGEPIKAKFFDYGLPEDTFSDLAADVAAFNDANQNQKSAGIESVGANADLDEVFEQILEIRRKLKVVVKNAFGRDAEKFAEWTTASHIERPQKRRETNEPPTT